MRTVIPAKARIQCFQNLLDAPVSSTGQAPQVRHDGKDICIRPILFQTTVQS